MANRRFFSPNGADQRIAVLTDRKFPGEKWPAAEVASHPVRLYNGEIVVFLEEIEPLPARGTF